MTQSSIYLNDIAIQTQMMASKLQDMRDFSLVGGAVALHASIALVLLLKAMSNKGNKYLRILTFMSTFTALIVSMSLTNTFIVNCLVHQNPIAENTKFLANILVYTNLVSAFLLLLRFNLPNNRIAPVATETKRQVA